MDFDDIKGKRKTIAGSLGMLLSSDPELEELLSEYGDGCMKCYGIDVRTKRTFLSAQIARMAKGFIADYGVDAKRIVKAAFEFPYSGKYRGSPFGPSLFHKNKRYMADDILMSIGCENEKFSWFE